MVRRSCCLTLLRGKLPPSTSKRRIVFGDAVGVRLAGRAGVRARAVGFRGCALRELAGFGVLLISAICPEEWMWRERVGFLRHWVLKGLVFELGFSCCVLWWPDWGLGFVLCEMWYGVLGGLVMDAWEAM